MSNLGIVAIGFTHRGERDTGADILIPLGHPRILQFKASRSGLDGSQCRFRINTNGVPNRGILPNQHFALDAIGRSGLCDTVYVFPLIHSDSYFVSNMGQLLRDTIIVDAVAITNSVSHRSAGWFSVPHSITVDIRNNFHVRSNVEGRGSGVSAKDFLAKMKQEIEKAPTEKTPRDKLEHETITETVRELESAVREAGVVGSSEHTLSFVAWNATKETRVVMSLPVRLKGLKEKREPKLRTLGK